MGTVPIQPLPVDEPRVRRRWLLAVGAALEGEAACAPRVQGRGKWVRWPAVAEFFDGIEPMPEQREWVRLGTKVGMTRGFVCKVLRFFCGPEGCARMAAHVLRWREVPGLRARFDCKREGTLIVGLEFSSSGSHVNSLLCILLGQIAAAPGVAGYPPASWQVRDAREGRIEAALNFGPSVSLSRRFRHLWSALRRSPATAATLVNQQHRLFEREREISVLQQEMLRVGEEDRRRLAMDVHDHIGQTLAAMGFRAEALRKALEEDRSPLEPEAAELVTLAESAMRQSRLLARGLDPVSQIEGGLAVAIQNFVKLCLRLHQGAIVCEIDPSLPALNSEAETHLFRISREAIQNALRHGGPTSRVDFRIEGDEPGDRLHLEVTNETSDPLRAETDGVGIGLKAMRYRTEQLNGRFQASMDPSAGRFAIRCEFKLSPLLRFTPLAVAVHV